MYRGASASSPSTTRNLRMAVLRPASNSTTPPGHSRPMSSSPLTSRPGRLSSISRIRSGSSCSATRFPAWSSSSGLRKSVQPSKRPTIRLSDGGSVMDLERVMALWPILLDGASGTAAVHDELSGSSEPVHGSSPCAMFESGQEGPAMPTVITRNPHRLFFMAVGGVVLAIPLIGFAPTYYLKPLFGTPELRPLVQVHAALFTLWPVLVLAQVLLVRARRVDLHRTLGWTAVVLVPLMVVTGALVIMGKARPTIEARAFIFTPLLSLVLF